MSRAARSALAIVTVAVVASVPLAALADSGASGSLGRRLLELWLPVLLFTALWIYFIKRSKYGKLTERSLAHMDALESKMDRVIQLLEERQPPR